MWGAVLLTLTVVGSVTIFPVVGDAEEMNPVPSEPVGIGSILAAPDSYHLQSVTLQGRVKQVETLEPYSSGGKICVGAYRFSIQDDTGSIRVMMPGVCGKRESSGAPVVDSDRVLVQARIFSPGHPDGRAGVPFLVEEKDRILAVGQWLSRSGN